MAYTASYALAAPSGTTLKWSLSAAGTLHATLRNQTTGFTEQGTSGLWEWIGSTIPDGYRGVVVIHSGADISALSGLTASNTHAVLSVNPGEVERVEKALQSDGATGANLVLTSVIVNNPSGPGVDITGTDYGVKVVANDYGVYFEAATTAALYLAGGQYAMYASGSYTGIYTTGNDNGLYCSAGAGGTGHGIYAQGGATGGSGIYAKGLGDGVEDSGIYATSLGALGSGFYGEGKQAGHGLWVESEGNGHGLLACSDGTGNGARFMAGTTGNGLHVLGGSAGGDGAYFAAQGGNADGLQAAKHGTGADIRGEVTVGTLPSPAPTGYGGEGATAEEIVAALAGQPLVTRSIVQRDHIELYRGDSYQNSEGTGRRIPFSKAATETHWPTTLDTVHFYCSPTTEAINNGRATALQKLSDVACTITQATGDNQAFYLELTSTQTDDLSSLANPHDYTFQLVANKADHPATLREGTFSARQTLRTLA